MIEAVVAIALIGVTAAALATVATSVLAQSRLTTSITATREIATQIAEQETALGCGLLTGAEPAEILSLAASRCNLENPADLPALVVLGDKDRTFTRGSLTYAVQLRYQWLPDPDQMTGGGPPLTCAALATGEPAAISREVKVTPLGAGPDSTISVEAATYRLWQVESVPPDAAAYVSGQGGILVTGLEPNDAIDIRRLTDPETTVAIRRYGITIGADTCAWFPYLVPGPYVLGRFNGELSTQLNVQAGSTSLITASEIAP